MTIKPGICTFHHELSPLFAGFFAGYMHTHTWLAIAQAFDVDLQSLRSPERLHLPRSSLGLWACRSDGFYRFVYEQTRSIEGTSWLTNDRSPAQIHTWWLQFQSAHLVAVRDMQAQLAEQAQVNAD